MGLLEKVYKKNDSIVFRKIADEFILVPIRNDVSDLESIYTLNEVGARIWELIDGKREVGKIKKINNLNTDKTPSVIDDAAAPIASKV